MEHKDQHHESMEDLLIEVNDIWPYETTRLNIDRR